MVENEEGTGFSFFPELVGMVDGTGRVVQGIPNVGECFYFTALQTVSNVDLFSSAQWIYWIFYLKTLWNTGGRTKTFAGVWARR